MNSGSVDMFGLMGLVTGFACICAALSQLSALFYTFLYADVLNKQITTLFISLVRSSEVRCCGISATEFFPLHLVQLDTLIM